MTTPRSIIVSLRFEGTRFNSHDLEIEDLKELVAFKELVVDVAEELYRHHVPSAGRLPSGFRSGIELRLDCVQPGSAEVPLYAAFTQDRLPLDSVGDPLEESVAAVIGAVTAAERASKPLGFFPARAIPRFANFGSSLADDEGIVLTTPSGASATYTSLARRRICSWRLQEYEDRVVREGRVLEADVRDHRFELWMSDKDKDKCTVHYRPDNDDEDLVTTALKSHSAIRLRVAGVGQFGVDGRLNRITAVHELAPAPSDHEVAAAGRDLMRRFFQMADELPEDALRDAPTDGARRLDHYLYGATGT